MKKLNRRTIDAVSTLSLKFKYCFCYACWPLLSLNEHFHAISLSYDPRELRIQHVGESRAFEAHHDRLLAEIGIETGKKNRGETREFC